MSKILSKLKNKYFLSLAGNGIMSVLGMATWAILYRALSLSEMGLWVFFSTMVSLIDTFRSGFITTAFIKFYSGTSAQRSAEVIGSTWAIAYIITGILLIINIASLPAINMVTDQGIVTLIKWFGVTFLASLPMFMATCIVQAEQRFDWLLYIRAINVGSFIIFICTLIFMHIATLQNVIYANLVSLGLTSLVTIIAGWARTLSVKYKTKKGALEIFHFGKYSVGTTLSANLFKGSDTFIINFMLGPAALAIYNLGQKLIEIVEIPLRSFAATAMPELSVAYNRDDKGHVIMIMKKYAGLLTIALVPCCLLAVFFADYAIDLIGGAKYVGTPSGHVAANVLRLFMTFALLYPLDRFLALTLDVIHKPKINFIKVLIMLAANIIGDVGGIWAFGNVYGVAITTVFPTLIGAGIGYWALRRYYNFNLFSVFQVGYAEMKIWIRRIL